nr:MAG TPA: hypothetical protein [Caudoviricetes sp.]
MAWSSRNFVFRKNFIFQAMKLFFFSNFFIISERK